MYLSVRFGSMPATDPQQAQMQRTMSFISPLMLGFFGWRYHWPSAMVLYWFAYNIFTMAQKFYMLRRYHEPLSFADASTSSPTTVSRSGSDSERRAQQRRQIEQPRSTRNARSKRKNKKGA